MGGWVLRGAVVSRRDETDGRDIESFERYGAFASFDRNVFHFIN